MPRNRVALAVLASAGFVASGCGSDDPEPNSDRQPEAAQVEKAEPKRNSARAQMVECIKGGIGHDVTADDDPHNLSVKSPNGKLAAVVIVHPDAGAARKAVAQTVAEGSNGVSFGRAELIRHGASDTEAGVIANCVAAEYNRPRRR